MDHVDALTVGVGSARAESTKWIKTAPANLAAGDVVVIVDVTKAVAIANNPGSDKAPSATAVTLSDNKDQITGDVANTLEWVLEAAGEGKCCFKTGDNYLFVKGGASNDDGLRVGVPADGDQKAFELTTDEAHDNADFLAVVMSESENRYVGVKNQYISNSWKTPTAINDDIKDTRIAFFKKVVSNKQNAGISWEGTVDGNANIDLKAASPVFPTLANPNSLTGITYSSSNTWVAAIDAESGAITLKKRGTVTITASFAEDETYDAATVSYTLRIDDSSSEEGTSAHPFASPSVAIEYAKGGNATDGWTYFVTGRVSKIVAASTSQYVIPGVNDSSTDGTLTYYISDDGTTGDATKELQISSGRYKELAALNDHILSVGDIVTVCGPLVYASATNSIGGGIGGGTTGTTGTGTGEKTVKMEATNYIHEHTPVLSTTDMTINNGVVKSIDSFYKLDNTNVNGTKGAVTVESSKTDIASYNSEGMTLTANKIGESVITIKIPVTLADSKSYNLVSKFTLTVLSRDVAAESDGTYQLVTDASQLQDGDRLLIVGNYNDGEKDTPYAMSTKQNDANRGAVTVTISENTISEVSTDAQVITLEKSGDDYYFNVGSDSYLYASSSEADELKMDTKANAGEKAKATITINGESKEATIAFGGGMTHNTVRFDCMGIMGYIISSDFACYTSEYTINEEEGNTATLPKIYRFVANPSYTITTSARGYKTLVSSVDVSELPSGLKAYIVSSIEEDKAKMTEVTSIKAGEAYILKGEASTEYTLNKATTAVSASAGNKLKVSDSSTANGVYVFATPSEKETGFYKWNGGRLGSGRVYLPAEASSRLFIGIDENVTGINEVRGQMEEARGNFYNLNGQRVAQPTKGLYIVNGKKVIVK